MPTLFSAEPTLMLTAGDGLHDHDATNVVAERPRRARAGRRRFTVPFTNLTEDTWFVVVVKGTDGVSRPMFPVIPANLRRASNTTLADLIDGNLGESGVMALGFTNALYADVDGKPGFNAPRTP